MRTFLSLPALLVAMAGLAGCYDLSAPDGPRREDFMPDPTANGPAASETQTREQDQAHAATRASAGATAAEAIAVDESGALVEVVDPMASTTAPDRDAGARAPW